MGDAGSPVPSRLAVKPLAVGSRLLAGAGNTSLAVGFAVAVGATPSLTRPAALLVIGMGVMAWAAWFSVAPAGVPPAAAWRRSGTATWVGLAAAFGFWELTAYVLDDDGSNPTFSDLADPVLAWPPARVLAALGWVAGARRLAGLVHEMPPGRADR